MRQSGEDSRGDLGNGRQGDPGTGVCQAQSSAGTLWQGWHRKFLVGRRVQRNLGIGSHAGHVAGGDVCPRSHAGVQQGPEHKGAIL